MTSQSSRLASHWRETPLVHILGPMQEFINQSQSGGIILLVTTVIALLLANSPFQAQYFAILDTHVAITVGTFVVDESVLHWINDGLMALFFFLVGLEIKRETLVGELASPRAAALPIVAAVGGVGVPALIYSFFNRGGVGIHGWGIPVATDIAFALGCLALLGNRIPLGLKVFLTAVAIVDDLMAVVVIALFYSGGLDWGWLSAGLGMLLVLLGVNIAGIRNPVPYILLGVLVWLAFLHSGVHATIAGVLVALTIPARRRVDAPTFLGRAYYLLQHFEQGGKDSKGHSIEAQQSAVLELEEACEDIQAPLQKMEHALHGWVALGVMPIFALANAGVVLSADSLNPASLPVLLGIVLGLTLGKPLGIMGASWLSVRFRLATLPQGVSWQHMLGVSILAGMGFTMSLFIASLAFDNATLLATAKLAILLASLLAGILGLVLLVRIQQRNGSS